MKFSLSKEAALAALSPVVGVIPDSHSIPILTNVAIEAADGFVTFRGRGDALQATATVAAEVEEPGATTVTADTLADIVRKTKAETIAFKQATPDARLEVRAGSSLFRLAPLPIGDMPAFSEIEYAVSFQMAGAVFAECLSKCRVAISHGKSAQASLLGGVRLAVSGDQMHLVGLNGHQYMLVRQDRPEGWPDGLGVTINSDTIDQFIGIGLSQRDGPVTVSLSRDRASVSAGSISISAPTMNSTGFPDYLAMADKFGNSVNVRMKVNRADLADAIRRIVSIGNVWAKSDKAVKIECEADHMTITAKSHVGDAMERIEVEDGAPMTLGFNPDFLLPLVDQIDGEILTMGLTEKGGRKTEGAVILTGEHDDATAFVGQRIV